LPQLSAKSVKTFSCIAEMYTLGLVPPNVGYTPQLWQSFGRFYFSIRFGKIIAPDRRPPHLDSLRLNVHFSFPCAAIVNHPGERFTLRNGILVIREHIANK
jgi:hypothetical protein